MFFDFAMVVRGYVGMIDTEVKRSFMTIQALVPEDELDECK